MLRLAFTLGLALGTIPTAQEAPLAGQVQPDTAQPAQTPESRRDTRVSGLPAPQLTRPDVEAWLDGFLPYALQRGDVAGAVVVVVKDGQVLLLKGYGYADVAKRIRVDAERTLFRGGSVAKLFTWTAVMQLLEQGRVDLDRDVNTYLDFSVSPLDGQPITLRNVMTHTPGFEEIVKNLMVSEPERLLPLGAYLKTRTPNRIFVPGTVPAYSNYGAALAGYIVERVSGESFDGYLDRHVFSPLGMAHSTFRQPLPARLAANMSQGYIVGSSPAQPYELVGPAPAGSLATTGADMARFMIAHLQSGAVGPISILKPETAHLMHRTPLPVIPPLNSMLLGFYQRNLNGRRIIGHDGDTQFFHSAVSLFADDGVGIFLSLNSTGKKGAAGPIRAALIEQFADRYFPAPEDVRTLHPTLAAGHARLMAGTYESSRRAQTTFFSLLNLATQVKVTVDSDGAILVPALVGLNGQPKKWRAVAPYVWHEVDGKARLAARVENGTVVMFSVDEVSPFLVFQPVPWWRSSSWLVPLVAYACGALILAIVGWPVSALVRRYHGIASTLTGSQARSYRLVRITAVATVAVLAGWVAITVPVSTNLFVYSARLDPWVWTLQLLSFVAFGAAAVISLWNAWLVWRGKRGWFARLWNVALAVACLGILWVAVVFKLIDVGADY